MAEKIVLDDEFTDKLSDWDESDIGKKIAKSIELKSIYVVYSLMLFFSTVFFFQHDAQRPCKRSACLRTEITKDE